MPQELRSVQGLSQYQAALLEFSGLAAANCSTVSCCLQVTRNKAITYSLTFSDSVSLDTGFLATAVKNLLVVLPCSERKAILHNTKMWSTILTACEVS